MSADLHAALTALADEWREAFPDDTAAGINVRAFAYQVRELLAAHPATDADLIAEAEDRGYEKGLLAPGSSWMKTRAEDIAQAKRDGAAVVVERVERVLAQHWDWKAGRSLYAAVRAAVRATEEMPT